MIAEPTPQYTDRMSAELTGAWSQDQAMWRALGLMRGPATEATVAETLSGWQDAVYSSVDGQVYRDEAVAGPQSDAQITEAMATASLDQEFGWSTEQPSRTLDDAAQTGAEVIRQTREVLASSPFAVELEPVEPAALTFVPPVVGYRVLAPAAFAEFENGAAGTENALERDRHRRTRSDGIRGAGRRVESDDDRDRRRRGLTQSDGPVVLVPRLRRLPRPPDLVRRQ